VLSLHRDRAGRLWIGTNGGLNQLQPDSGFSHFGGSGQFLSSVIYAIQEDEAGLLWLSTNRGLLRFDPAAPVGTGAQVFSGPGVGNVEFNRHAGFKGRDGTLYFGGDRGITFFHPAALKDNPFRPPVVITALHRSSQRGVQIHRYVDDRLPIRLNRDDYTVSFDLAALSYTDSPRNQFEYRLAGLRDEWIKLGTSHRVSFTNLPPGRYRLEVRAANEDGAWNEAGLSVPVIVPPWFWETWWFRTLAVVIAAVLISTATGFVLRTRHRLQLEGERRRHALERERARISRDMHDEVGASLTEIALLSERTLRENRGNGGTEHLGKIGQRSRETLASIGEIVWAINPDNDRLDRLAAYLREYSSAFLESAGLTARLRFDTGNETTPLSAELRRQVFLVLKEALANAVTHARASTVEVTFDLRDRRLRLGVRDDGAGFRPGEAEGPSAGQDGLANMRRRAADLGATLRVDSTPGGGTRVELEVPV
jgi:signal transduction histidine kinase